jgi:hypothetical protein
MKQLMAMVLVHFFFVMNIKQLMTMFLVHFNIVYETINDSLRHKGIICIFVFEGLHIFNVKLFICILYFLVFFQVSVCAACNQITTYGAFVIGIIGGIMYMITTWTVLRLKVDDPLDATAGTYFYYIGNR